MLDKDNPLYLVPGYLHKAEGKPDPKVLRVAKSKNSQQKDWEEQASLNLEPAVNAAISIQRVVGQGGRDEDLLDATSLARTLKEQILITTDGDMKVADMFLVSQAFTLDTLFNSLTRLAMKNIAGNPDFADRTFRLALKAQSQCRATLEGLAQIKNPPTVFANQANIANGHQQVNNNASLTVTSVRTGKSNKAQNKQLEQQHGERLDVGTKKAPGRADPVVAAVGKVDRAQKRSRKGRG